MLTKPILNRYTTLPVLLDMLLHKRIVLLSPSTWEDRNDSHYLERYKEAKSLTTVLALCFSKKHETFHQWKIFSTGMGGVCIMFDRDKLLKPIAHLPGMKIGDVKYLKINDVKTKSPIIEDWPFIKRKPYEDEDELRIVYEHKTEDSPSKNLSLSLNSIIKITLSPWTPASLAESIKSVVKSIDGCKNLKINKSTLLENTEWKKAIKANVISHNQKKALS